MAVNMTFYSGFSKRDNSTKQPTGGTVYTVVFKEAFSIIGGTVKLQVNFDTAKNYTAAKYGNNFYKVVDVISTNNNIVEITLALDILATYKSAIAGYTCLIERAPVDSEIAYLPDNTISPNLDLDASIKQIDFPISPFGDGVCVKVTTIGATNAQCYYMSVASLGTLLTSTELANAFSDLSQFIKSIEIVPIPLEALIEQGSTPPENVIAQGLIPSENVMLGNQHINVSCYAIVSAGLVYTKTHTIQISDALYKYTDARKIQSDYTKWIVTMNNTDFEIPAELNTNSSIIIKVQLDLITLDALATISVGTKLIGSTQSTVGVPYAYNSSDPVLKSIVSAMIASKGNILLGAAKAYSESVHAVDGVTPPGGSLSAVNFPVIKAVLYEHKSTEKSPSTNGYPYHKVNTINSINVNGFYKFENPSIPIAALSSVRNEVNGFLSQGFYYE